MERYHKSIINPFRLGEKTFHAKSALNLYFFRKSGFLRSLDQNVTSNFENFKRLKYGESKIKFLSFLSFEFQMKN